MLRVEVPGFGCSAWPTISDKKFMESSCATWESTRLGIRVESLGFRGLRFRVHGELLANVMSAPKLRELGSVTE